MSNLPSLPTSSLLPLPQAGDLSSQLSQGESLLNLAQGAASGQPGATDAFLKAGATALSKAAGGGLASTLITDAAGIAAGFAMGGPVGAVGAAVGAVAGIFSSLFEGSPGPTNEGYVLAASTASKHNYANLSNYITNVISAVGSGSPPGWYLLAYYLTQLSKSSAQRMLDRYSIVVDFWDPTLGSDDARAWEPDEVQISGTLTASGEMSVTDMRTATPWATASAEDPNQTIFEYTVASQQGQDAASAKTQAPYDVTQGNANILELAYNWASLPTSAPQPAWTSGNFSDNVNSAQGQVLTDIVAKPRMTKAQMLAFGLAHMPDPVWFLPDMYGGGTTGAYDADSNSDYSPVWGLDVLTAIATVGTMLSQAVHPRGISTELLMQQRTIYEFGGSGTAGEHNLSSAFRNFVDEWLSIAAGHAPSVNVPVLGTLSPQASSAAKMQTAQHLTTLRQWVAYYAKEAKGSG